jgi:uncharacterized protein (DUF1499 family)
MGHNRNDRPRFSRCPMVLLNPLVIVHGLHLRRLTLRLLIVFGLSVCLTLLQGGTAVAMPIMPAIQPLASLFHISGDRPVLGVYSGHLAACPATPNCIGSQETEPLHRTEALALQPDAIAKLTPIVQAIEGAQIIKTSDDYLYAEISSSLFGFVDDLEFWVNPDGQRIEVRSGARLGESDLGVNSKRLELIRSQFAG